MCMVVQKKKELPEIVIISRSAEEDVGERSAFQECPGTAANEQGRDKTKGEGGGRKKKKKTTKKGGLRQH